MNESIQVDALNNLLSSNSVKQMLIDADGNTIAERIINDFVGDDLVLKGDDWISVKGKLSEYSSLFLKRAKCAKELYLSINSAIKLLLDYLGEDLYLDPSRLEEIQQTKLRCEDLILDLGTKINSTQEVEVVDDEGNVTYTVGYVYSASERENFRAKLIELRDETIPELSRLIEKINGLSDIYGRALAELEKAYNQINTFNRSVNYFKSSDKVTLSL